nr:NAC domain-containing protein [Tanacetum cinerariifolium]
MIDREKIMMVAGGNIMRKTPQVAYDLIENMKLPHFQWDTKVYYDTTTGYPNTVEYTYSNESNDDEPSKAYKSEIDPLIKELTSTFLTRDETIKVNSHEDINDLVPIPRVSEKPLDSRDPISKNFNMTITNPLFDFDSELTLNSDNEESDESETKTIMEEVQIHSSQSTAQIPPSYH